MERKNARSTGKPLARRYADSKRERGARPLPKSEVLTLADDTGCGGDPYNSAERWARPDRDDD